MAFQRVDAKVSALAVRRSNRLPDRVAFNGSTSPDSVLESPGPDNLLLGVNWHLPSAVSQNHLAFLIFILGAMTETLPMA
jgi:hypothetical protein